MVPLDNPVTLSLAGNKPLCYKMFRREGLPVPIYRTFRSGEPGKMKDFIEEHKGFFVIKPAVGTGAGKGVTTHLKTYRECLRAVALASLFGDEVIIEQVVPGECYRLLVLDGAVLHASRRRGFRVVGDGDASLWHLVERENTRRGKRAGDGASRPIGYDRDVMATLHAQDLSREFVPAAGREILVRSSDSPAGDHVEIRTEYNENATHLLCGEILDQAVRAASVLDSRFAGVDIITLDPTEALGGKRGVINEINTTPGLHHHYDLLNNDPKPVAVDVLRYLLGNPS
jgi:cyanophycin synthetase